MIKKSNRQSSTSHTAIYLWYFLRKLKNQGLIQKDEAGEYIVKEKTGISGHIWIGRNLVPRLIFYSLFFLGIIIFEVVILLVQFFSADLIISFPLVYLLITNIIAFVLFFGEGLLLQKKIKE